MKKIKEESVGGDREVEGRVKGNKDMFDAISPFDFRYYGRDEKAKRELGPYLSERAFIVYQLRVECALVKVLADRGICNQSVYREVKHAAGEITPEEVYAEEDKIHHNIRALVNCIQKRVSYAAKPFVHLTATSYDIIENANAARYRDAACAAVIPELCKLMDALIALALREKNTLQAGRTHGQHAEPITFGFTVSGYVARLGDRIEALQRAASSLRGKFSGAVGAYNASALFFSDPEGFEKDVLKELGLEPCMQSSQVAQAEYLTDFVHAVVSCFSVLANIADDMRHLQRSEINEIAEV
ncbi:adenylosuccinate lyase, partial [Candidatus Woesearchaeota archaeon CG_4_10_14_0_8_um_filter_47_5]